jgi:hypothetical protein
MNLTEDTIDALVATAAKDVYKGAHEEFPRLRKALESLPEPVAGPFVLSSEEESAVLDCEGTGQAARVRRVAKLVRRAQRTLAAPAQAGGEWTLDDYDAAAAAVFAIRVSGNSSQGSMAVAALDAVKHRLAAPAQAGGGWTRVDLMTAYEAAECSADSDIANNVRAALFALEHRLAAPAIEPLSAGEESVLAYVEKYDAPKDAHVNELVLAVRKRFPKPEPAPVLNPIEALLAKWKARASTSPAADCFASELEEALAAHEASK